MTTSESRLLELEEFDSSTGSPWIAFVENRDFQSGASFIMVGTAPQRGDDIYVSKNGIGADADLLDLIAGMRTLAPVLLASIRRIRDGDASSLPTEVVRFEKLIELSRSCEPATWHVIHEDDSGRPPHISVGANKPNPARIEITTDSGPADESLLLAVALLRNEVESLLTEVLQSTS